MNKILLSSIALSALVAGPALAADIAVKAPPYRAPVVETLSWTGPYLGIHGGYGWGRTNYTDLGGGSNGASNLIPTGTVVPFSSSFGARGQQDENRSKGGMLGYVSGINWQTGAWVMGMESSFDGTHIKGDTGEYTHLIPPATNVFKGVFGSDLKWLATATTKLGLTWGSSLLYVKGGLAGGRLDVTGIRTNGTTANGDHFAQTQYRAGWTFGGGWDYMLTRNWIIGVEANYVDLRKQAVAGRNIDGATGAINGGGEYDESVKFKMWDVMARLMYRFDWSAPVVAARY